MDWSDCHDPLQLSCVCCQKCKIQHSLGDRFSRCEFIDVQARNVLCLQNITKNFANEVLKKLTNLLICVPSVAVCFEIEGISPFLRLSSSSSKARFLDPIFKLSSNLLFVIYWNSSVNEFPSIWVISVVSYRTLSTYHKKLLLSFLH